MSEKVLSRETPDEVEDSALRVEDRHTTDDAGESQARSLQEIAESGSVNEIESEQNIPINASGSQEGLNECDSKSAVTLSSEKSSNLTLGEYKAATIKLLDQVSSEITTVPESDVSEETSTCTPAARTIDLTKSDSVDIVTLTSESSQENSRSSKEDDAEITVDLTNESNKDDTRKLGDVQKTIPQEHSSSEEPAVKRQKLETDSIQVDLTEDSNMSVEIDVVVVQESKENSPTPETDFEVSQRYIYIYFIETLTL